MRQLFWNKMRQLSYKMRRFCYKMQRLLQNAPVQTTINMTKAPTEEWYVVSMELTDTYMLMNSLQPYDYNDSKYKCKQHMLPLSYHKTHEYLQPWSHICKVRDGILTQF